MLELGHMKTLVVFYSRTGNTKKVAEEIAKILNADIEEIIDKKDRKGIVGWLKSGRDATFKKSAEIEFVKNPIDYDLVIIGTPIWAFTMTPAIRTYLSENKFKKVAFFSTSGGSEGEKIFNEMEKISREPVATLSLLTKNWPAELNLEKEENSEKIKEFCKKLY